MLKGLRDSVVSCRRILPVLLLLPAALGCHFPQPVPSYECVTDYDRMSGQYEPLVSLVYAPKPLDLRAYRGIIVGPVKLGGTWIDGEEDAAHYATLFRVCLLKELSAQTTFQKVGFDSRNDEWGGSLRGVLRIDSMITRFDMGSGWMRYLSCLVFLQSGATDLQVEGRVTEADSGKLVLEFADRRRTMGNTPWGPNPKNFERAFAMNVTTHATALAFARFFSMVRGEREEGAPPVKSQATRRVALEGSR